VEELRPQLEKASGATLSIRLQHGGDAARSDREREAFDVAILTDDAIDALIKAGKLSPALRTKLARVGIGVGFRKGARSLTCAPPPPSAGAANAKAIAYTGNGASRPAIDKMIERLGIAKELQPKAHLTAAGAAPASGCEKANRISC